MPLRRRRAAWIATCAFVLYAAPVASASTAPIVRLAGGQPGQFVAPTPATLAQPPLGVKFENADGVTWDRSSGGSSIYFTDNDVGDNRVFHLGPNGLSLFAGSGSFIPTDGALTAAGVPEPTGVGQWGSNLYITSASQFVSGGALRYFNDLDIFGDNISTLIDYNQGMLQPRDLSVDYDNGYGFLADSSRGEIRTFDNTGSSTIVAGNPLADPQDPSDPMERDIGAPSDVALLGQYEFLFTNADGVWRVTNAGFPDDDAIVQVLDFNWVSAPSSILALNDGGYLVYDSGNHRIRRLADLASPVPGPGTTYSTVAGDGTDGVAAPGTPADQAPLVADGDLTVTPDGLVMTQGDAAVVQMIPAVAITSGPDALTTSHSATFALASWDDGATYECKLDDGAAAPCESGAVFQVADGDHEMSITALTTGPFGAFPSAFRSSKVIRTWSVDSIAPSPFALLAPAAGETTDSTTLRWEQPTDAGPGEIAYALVVDGTQRADPITCADGVCSATPALPDGPHTWQVTATDDARNARQSSTGSFTTRQPPTASLTISPNPVLIGRNVTFDASKSGDPNGEIVEVAWDLDGTAGYELNTGANRVTTRSFDKPATRTVGVRVTDSGGNTATASATLTISALPPAGKQLGVSINDGAQYTNDPKVTVHAVWPVFASDMLISNDGGFKLAQRFTVAEKTPWTLDSSGPERLPKTIYVRFLGGVQTSETYQDDIILDQTAPKVLAATFPKPGGVRAAAAKIRLKLRATDNVSGVSRVQVTANKRKPGKFLRYKRTLKVKPARRLFVRARDRAGNLSRWRAAKRR